MNEPGKPGRYVHQGQVRRPRFQLRVAALVAIPVVAAVAFVVIQAQSEDAVGVVEEYIDTFNSGDVDATLAFLVDNGGEFASITDPRGTPYDLNGYENLIRLVAWQVSGKGTLVDSQCSLVDPEVGNVVSCVYQVHDVTKTAMGFPSLLGSLTAEVDDGRLVSYVASVVLGENSSDDYIDWLEQTHPEEVTAAGDLIWNSVENAVLAGSTRARYVDEWAAWLNGEG